MTEDKKYRCVEWQPTPKQLDAYYGIKTEKIKIKKKKKGENK